MVLAASIIAADAGRLEEQARAALSAGAEWLHVDVMDGHFVPNITVGPLVVEGLRPLANETEAPLDVHLMIEEPARYVDAFAEAGADLITVHAEACRHLHRTVQAIGRAGARAGVALNPATPLLALDEILPALDLVLLMSVNPGFSGQDYIPETTGKLRRLHRHIEQRGAHARVEVDGGIGPENAAEVVQAGADVLVAGSAVFGGDRSIEENVHAFRDALVMEA